jgi:HicA-like toxin of HicAB toxin-antitoxin system
MSKIEKLLERFLSNPKDFTWDELVSMLTHFGYYEHRKGKTGGSRRKFLDANKNVINLHKPHPGNILKRYAINLVIEQLKEKGKIYE